MKRKLFLLSLVCLLILSCQKGEKSFPGVGPGGDSEPGRFISSYMDPGGLSPIRYYKDYQPETEAAVIYESEEPFIMVDYSPVGELPSEIYRPQISILFSQPVVPLTALGEPSGTSGAVTISPPAPGVFRWYGSRLLVFESSEDLLPQREYTVTVNPGIKSLGGKTYSGISSFSFKTEYLSIRNLFFGRDFRNTGLTEVSPSNALVIGINFNYPVNPLHVSSFLRINLAGRDVPFSVIPTGSIRRLPEDREAHVLLLRLETPLPENSSVTLKLEKGAASFPESLASSADQIISFSTLSPFRFLEASAESYAFPASERGNINPVFLTFSHPLKAEDAYEYVSTSLGKPIDREDVSIWGRTLRIGNIQAEPETSFIIFLQEGLKDLYGRSLPRRVSVPVTAPAARSYAYFPNTGTRFLEAAFPPLIVFEHQNIGDGEWKIDRISDPYSSFDPEELYPFDFTAAVRNRAKVEILDLSPYLNSNGRGFVGLSWNFSPRDRRGVRPAWGKEDLQVQVTDLGLSVRYGYNRVIAFVTSLSTGKPVSNVSVALMREDSIVLESTADQNGLAVFSLEPGTFDTFFGAPGQSWRDLLRIMVDTGRDKIIFAPNQSHNPYRHGLYNVESPADAEKTRSHVYFITDRDLYRPGDTVNFRGIQKELLLGSYFSFSAPYSLTLLPAYGGAPLGEIKGTSSDSGGFHGAFNLPQNISPGYYEMLYEREGQKRFFPVRVAEFKPVSFLLSLKPSDRPFFIGDILSAEIRADYLSGGPVAGARAKTLWFREAARFSLQSEELAGFTFGPQDWDYRVSLETGEAVLDRDGKLRVSLKTGADGIKGMPYRYTLESRVMNQAMEEVSGNTDIIVHPASFYIGSRFSGSDSEFYGSFAETGKPQEVEYILIDPLGNLVQPGNDTFIIAELFKEDWRMARQQGEDGRVIDRYEKVLELEESLSFRPASSGSFSITPKEGSSYILRLSCEDNLRRPAVTELSFYSAGGGWVYREGEGDLTLVPDKPVYTPGETAKVLLKTPLAEGYYLITLEREGIFEQRLEYLSGGSEVLGIPIRKEFLPIVYLSVSSFSTRSGEPSHTYYTPDLDRPKGYYGVIPLLVDTAEKRIDLSIETSAAPKKPGERVEMTIKATRGGRPVPGAEITFLAVDRGVLSLTGYEIPDPLKFFWGGDRFPLFVRGADSRSLLMDPVTYDIRNLQGGDYGGDKGEEEAIRSDFRPTAVFIPEVKTDAQGRAVISFTLPDSLTAFRCTAIALNEDRFGFTERDIRVSSPLAVRPIVPKKTRVRDTLFAGVLVTNDTGQRQKVTVLARAELSLLDGPSSREIVLESGESREVLFPLLSVKEGTEVLEFSISAQNHTERLILSYGVEEPSVFEYTALAGSLPGGVLEEGFVIPGYPGLSGSLTVGLSSGWKASLADGLYTILKYPYGSTDQRAGFISSLLFYGGTAEKQGFLGIERAGDLVNKEISRLSDIQREDGGFPFWPDGLGGSSAYATLRTAHALALAKKQGYSLPQELDIRKLLVFLDGVSRSRTNNPYLSVYALYCRALFGEKLPRLAGEFLSLGDRLGTGGYSLLGLAYLEMGYPEEAGVCYARAKQFISQTTRGIDLSDTYESRGVYGGLSERISLILILSSELGKDEALRDKTAETLLNRKRNGFWDNTAGNAWALIAFAGLRDEPAGVRGTVSISGKELLSAEFPAQGQGLDATLLLSEEPLVSMPRDKLLPLRIEALGEGKIRYSSLFLYNLPMETAGPRDEGLGIYTEIMDLSGNRVAETSLAAGETYRFRIVLSSPRNRDNVILRVPIPSGAEPVDTSFVTSSGYMEVERERDYSLGFFREEIRDNEVRYFFPVFTRGTGEIEFFFRAVYRGIFPTPPVTAECLYQPEIFGRSAGRLFIVEQ